MVQEGHLVEALVVLEQEQVVVVVALASLALALESLGLVEMPALHSLHNTNKGKPPSTSQATKVTNRRRQEDDEE